MKHPTLFEWLRCLAGISILLIWVGGVHAEVAQASVSPVSIKDMPGWRIMQDTRLGNCVTCHAITWPGQAALERQGNFAPALNGVAHRYSRDQLWQWVVDARVLHPNTLMPSFGTVAGLHNVAIPQPVLDASQINAVLDVLEHLK